MKPKLTLLTVLLLSSVTQAHSVGRWCSNSYCDMCNRLHLIAGHGQSQSAVGRLGHSQLVNLHTQGHKPQPPRVDSTPQFVVDAMLESVSPTADEILCDVGCGDGRVVIAAAKKYGCKAIGIEIKKDVAALARANVRKSGVSHLVTIVCGDARDYSFDGISVVTMYLFPDLMEELQAETLKASRVVSYSHEIPNVQNQKIMVREKYAVYVWAKSNQVSVF